MDSGTLIITVVFLSIIIVPFILTGYSRKRKKENLFRRLSELADNEDCVITQYETSGNSAIGLDEMANRFFFFKKATDLEISKSVNLKEFKSCKTFNSGRSLNDKKSRYDAIGKIEIYFHSIDKSIPDTSVELYNEEYDSLTLAGELQMAEKWENLLNEQMKTLQKPGSRKDIRPPVNDIKIRKSQKRTA